MAFRKQGIKLKKRGERLSFISDFQYENFPRSQERLTGSSVSGFLVHVSEVE